MDIELGSIIAYRQWVLGKKNNLPVLLPTIMSSTPWPYGTVEAMCHIVRSHHAPVRGCTCGIYAMKTPPWENLRIPRELPVGTFINGTVELFGKVIIHEYGYRAQYGRVTSLSDIVDCSMCRQPFAIGSNKLTYLTIIVPHQVRPIKQTKRIIYAFCDECRNKAYEKAKDKRAHGISNVEILATAAGVIMEHSIYLELTSDSEVREMYEGIRKLYLSD